MFVLYGAQSPGQQLPHPRDMDPAGQYAGFVSSSLMSLSGTQEGGSLMFIDAANYSEHNTPANSTVPASGGQAEVTDKPLNQGRGPLDVRPRHHALSALGRQQPGPARLPPVRGDPRRRRHPLRQPHAEESPGSRTTT
jgi:hypothetical protein